MPNIGHVLYTASANDINGVDESVDEQWQTPISSQCLLYRTLIMHVQRMNECFICEASKKKNGRAGATTSTAPIESNNNLIYADTSHV